MKHRNIITTIAVLAAAGAQAQSSVSISGYADGSVIIESGGVGSVKKVGSGVSGPSRLIFRGTEDLGSGLSAFFHLESGVLFDTGGSLQAGFFGRQSFVGLNGPMGNLKLGLQYTPVFTTLRDVGDPFRASYAGNAGNLVTVGVPGGPKSVGFPNTSAGNGVAQGGISRANTAQYTSPNFGGFTGELAYSFGEQNGDNSKLRTYGGSAGYAKGPLNVRLAHSDTNNATGLLTERNSILAGNYNFGVAKLFLTAAANKNYASAKSRDYLIGVSVPVGQGQVMASYVRKDDRSAADNDAHQLALGYVYFLSKRTQLHASIAKISNSVPNTSPGFYTVSTPAGPGTGNRAIAFGIGHFF